MHGLRKSDNSFIDFGEAYFSKINSGVVKGWKYHKKMSQNFSVPYGKLKLVFEPNDGSDAFEREVFQFEKPGIALSLSLIHI